MAKTCEEYVVKKLEELESIVTKLGLEINELKKENGELKELASFIQIKEEEGKYKKIYFDNEYIGLFFNDSESRFVTLGEKYGTKINEK